uniref:eukaryotic translation initiation factor 4E type 3-like isoform X5 n=1 Tax=Vespula vulgaris TaxID=7454 RepID=UPI00223A962A|nr:eukaryotic translation initiation factor 4E type 3-like isoform X5 [Vespula vulgaris]
MISEIKSSAHRVSKMAAVQCESKDDDSESDLSKSPVFSSKTVEAIEEHDNTGLPLQSSWTFWLDKAISGTTAEEYKANLKKIYTVNTVQSFWAVFNNIPNAAEIQAKIWQEVVLAAIGEQFAECVAEGDEVCGVTVSIRDREDLIQVFLFSFIWNVNAALAPKATILQRVHVLLPEVNFLTEFYKAHQSHHAYGRC